LGTRTPSPPTMPSLPTILCGSMLSTCCWTHPPQSWTGYSIYLAKGLVITAAHVAGSASRTKPIVRIAGMDLFARAIGEGWYEWVDLTLLSIDEQKLPIYLRMRRMPLCERAPWVAKPVIVAVPEGTARSHIMSPSGLPNKVFHGD
jgi:hypothetical protein